MITDDERPADIEVRETSDTLEDIGFSFNISDAGDIRYMLIQAADFAAKGISVTSEMKYVHRVLKTQADMITQGLADRNLDEVPDFMGDIERFHQLFGLEYIGKPRMLPRGLHDFRYKFILEEATEYNDEYPALADAVSQSDEQEIAKRLELQLDALVDLQYVTLGAAYLQFGSKVFNAAWKRVHEANMKKERAEAEGDARSKRDTKYDVVKPEGWVAPGHSDLVANHAHLLYRKEGDLNPGHAINGKKDA